MAGGQIYADDVASPMLVACQSLCQKLGLYSAKHLEGTPNKKLGMGEQFKSPP